MLNFYKKNKQCLSVGIHFFPKFNIRMKNKGKLLKCEINGIWHISVQVHEMGYK